MTQYFRDVIQELTDGLHQLDTMTKSAVDYYNSGTTQFQNYVTSNITGVPGSIFFGKGADACLTAVGRNVSRAQLGTTKLRDFQLACSQTRKSLDDLCSSFDNQSIYYLSSIDLYSMDQIIGGNYEGMTVRQYYQNALGFSPYATTDSCASAVSYISDNTLAGLGFQVDDLLTVGKGQSLLEGLVDQAAGWLKSAFQNYQSQSHSALDAEIKQGTIPKDSRYYYMAEIDRHYDDSVDFLNKIATKMKNGYGEWATEFQAIVGQFQSDMGTASDMQALTVGDLTNEINSSQYKNAKVLIVQTPNGIVVIVKGGVDPSRVEANIEKYLHEHHLPQNTQITMFGYKGGSDAAQQVILDAKYNVAGLILVGGQLKDNLSFDLNVTTYTQAPNLSPQQETTWLGLKPDQVLIPLATAAVLFFVTGGVGDIAEAGIGSVLLEKGGEIGTEYAASEIWNSAANNWNNTHPDQQIPIPQVATTVGPQLYVDEGGGAHPITRQEIFTIEQAAANHQPLPAGWKFFLRQNSYVPDESGANLNNFTNSSFLNSQVVS